MTAKQISQRDLLGHQGVGLIDRIVTEIGWIWRETPWADAGIDGEIEIRDPSTGAMSNCIIKVQSKATAGEFQSETESGFSYTCRKADLEYWLSGNFPVVLVVSRPADGSAFWVSVKDYFAGQPQAGHTVRFDKGTDRLDASDGCRLKLQRIALPADRGLYFAPAPTPEKIVSNLLPVRRFADTLYIAETSGSFDSRISFMINGTHDQFNGRVRVSFESGGDARVAGFGSGP